MAGIAVGNQSGGRRSLNHELPLVPFIDFLLCLVAFLLVTAVWSQMARLAANARVPGDPDITGTPPSRILHLDTRSAEKFQLIWREGGVVVGQTDVPRKAVPRGGEGDVGYPQLREALTREWSTQGQHRSPSDHQRDTLVVHASNTLPFGELAAMIDAAQGPEREVLAANGQRNTQPSFSVSFATD